MIFDICILIALTALIVAAAYLHRKAVAAQAFMANLSLKCVDLQQRIDATETLVQELKTQIEDIDPHAGVDAEALEKAFNEGVSRIMNYSLSTAMGGGVNG